MTTPTTRAPRSSRISARARNGLIGVAVLAAAVIVVLAYRARSDAKSGRSAIADKKIAKADTGMSGMAGMAGMSATTGDTVRLTAAQIRQFGVTFGTVETR